MEDEAEVRAVIRRCVWSGFYEADRIVEVVCEELYEPGEVDEGWARAAIAEEFARKADDEKTWPEVTDCDRLDEVFARLNALGIIALQNAGYTMSDGFEEVDQAYSEAGGELPATAGYCFYHGQDLERVVNGEGLNLAFGHLDGTDESGLKIGQRVKAVLEEAGFKVEWDGTSGRRLHVPEVDWKRRGYAS